MANINKSGLYVVIKNVNQLKKTINIINTLKSGKEINMHFTSEEIEGEKKNFLKISEDGINDSVSIVIQHELYSDEDKFKCVFFELIICIFIRQFDFFILDNSK